MTHPAVLHPAGPSCARQDERRLRAATTHHQPILDSSPGGQRLISVRDAPADRALAAQPADNQS